MRIGVAGAPVAGARLQDHPQWQEEVLEMFAGGTARLLMTNDGEAPLELTVEPWAPLNRA
ncbi:hypothetical protein [Kitasatospora purpeofusca]|uniref:hypothetical protein n=1 Tax=Kitasatospora purpeofusca TaxID=67352 RepID=UPI0036C096A2